MLLRSAVNGLRLGLSLDYTRERFTLDEGLSKAVRKVFVDLYNDGLDLPGGKNHQLGSRS